jgi:hypothetical protein
VSILVEVGDLIELKLVGNYKEVMEVNNIFQFQVESIGTGSGSPAALDEFAMGFLVENMTNIVGFTSVAVKYTSIEAKLYDPVHGVFVNGQSIPILGGDGDGLVSGEVLPPYVTYTFKYVREDASKRHGFKRFCGVPESVNEDGHPTSAALGNLASAAEVFASDLPAYTVVDGAPGTQISTAAALPVIVSRIFNGDFLDPIIIASPSTVIFDKFGTQNSRKFGVGV